MDAHQLVFALQRCRGRRLRWETVVASGAGTWVARDGWRRQIEHLCASEYHIITYTEKLFCFNSKFLKSLRPCPLMPAPVALQPPLVSCPSLSAHPQNLLGPADGGAVCGPLCSVSSAAWLVFSPRSQPKPLTSGKWTFQGAPQPELHQAISLFTCLPSPRVDPCGQSPVSGLLAAPSQRPALCLAHSRHPITMWGSRSPGTQ